MLDLGGGESIYNLIKGYRIISVVIATIIRLHLIILKK
jgi:hypothetical protein